MLKNILKNKKFRNFIAKVFMRNYHISMKLKEFRVMKNLTQQQIADKLEINQKTYSNYENGRAEPSVQNLIKLAKLFGVSVDALVGNDASLLDLTTLDESRRYIINKIAKELDDVAVGKLIGYMDK